MTYSNRTIASPSCRVSRLGLLLSACLALTICTSCIRLLIGEDLVETPPADRVLGATRTCLGGLFIGDSSNFLPGYLTAPFFLCALPFAAVEDVVCLPYDLYLVGRYARNPSVAYCVLKGRNDKLHKLLEAGASVYDSGSGPFHLLETPEEIAIRCNKEALTELWSHGLKVSPKAIRYLAETLHVPLSCKSQADHAAFSGLGRFLCVSLSFPFFSAKPECPRGLVAAGMGNWAFLSCALL